MGIFKKITLALVLVLSAGFMFACKNTPKPNPPAPAPTPQPTPQDDYKKMSIKEAATKAKGTKIHVEGYYVNVGGYNKLIDGEGNALNLTYVYAKGVKTGDKVSMKAVINESQYGKEIAKNPKPEFTKLNDTYSAVDISNRPASEVKTHENKIVKFDAEIKKYTEETREKNGKQYVYITVRVSIADTEYEIKYDGRSEQKLKNKPILKKIQELKDKEGTRKSFEGLFLVRVKGELRFTPTTSFGF